MTRKLDAAQEGASPVLSLRLSPALAAALAAEAHRRSTAAGGVPVSPAAVARVLLERALLVGQSSSTPTPPAAVTDAAPQEAAQSPRRGSTPRSTSRARKAAAEPPTPAREADDDDQEAADARHAARNELHREWGRIDKLRDDLRALIEHHAWSARRIGQTLTAGGTSVSGRSVSQFINGSTEGWPQWGDAAREWADAQPKVVVRPDLQRPLFTPGEGTP